MNSPEQVVKAKYLAYRCLALAIWLFATVVADASTYPCRASEQIGSQGCIGVGLILAAVAGFVYSKGGGQP